MAGYLGVGLPLLAGALLLVLILKPSKKSLHGNARFANAGDLARHGMFKESDTGLIVGKLNGNLVRLGGQQFVILAAPTRSGKGVGVRSEEHTSELQSLMRISYAVFCLQKQLT